jgi:hypothetical protein
MKKLNEFIDYLGLELPVSVTLRTRPNKKTDGFYLPVHNKKGKLSGHKIVIYVTGLARPFDTILAHELIHAKQEEMKQEEIHGKIFRKFAKMMEEEFGLEQIYLPDIDLN